MFARKYARAYDNVSKYILTHRIITGIVLLITVICIYVFNRTTSSYVQIPDTEELELLVVHIPFLDYLKLIEIPFSSIVFSYPIINESVRIFHNLLGDKLNCEIKHDDSKSIILNVIKGTILVVGARGFGKDTFIIWIAVIKSAYYRSLLHDLMDKNARYLFRINLIVVKELIDEHYEHIFGTQSKLLRLERMLEIFRKNEQRVIKEYYYNQGLRIKDFEEDFDKHMENFESSKYRHTDTIRYKHFLTILYEYAWAYFRVDIIKVFIVSNQPVIDDEGNPAFIFSQCYKHFSGEKDAIKNPDDPSDENEYIKLIKFIAEDFMIVVQTEQDINKGNYQKGVAGDIKDSERPFDAIRRHITGDYYLEIKNGQTEGREHKLIRELNDFVIRVESKVKQRHHSKVRLWFLNRKFNRKENQLLKDRTEEDEHPLYVKRQETEEKIDGHIADGFLTLRVSVKTPDYVGGFAPASLERVLEGDLDHDSVVGKKLEFFMLKRETWGHYTTNYMDGVGEEIRKDSAISIIDAPRWSPDMLLNREHVKILTSPMMDKFAGITFEEIKELRYRVADEVASSNHVEF